MKNTIVHAFDINTGESISKFKKKKQKKSNYTSFFNNLFFSNFLSGYFFCQTIEMEKL